MARPRLRAALLACPLAVVTLTGCGGEKSATAPRKPLVIGFVYVGYLVEGVVGTMAAER